MKVLFRHTLCLLTAALLFSACGEDGAEHSRNTPPRPARPVMPAGEYKVGQAALQEIRFLYHAAGHRECFTLTPNEHRMLSAYLLTGDPKQTTKNGYTLLHMACHLNCPALVEELIARGADVNAVSYTLFDFFETTETGDVWRLCPLTPLSWAALPCNYLRNATPERCQHIIDLLLAAGADPKLGDSPLPHVAWMEHDYIHMEEAFLHLLDCGFTLEEERRSPELSAEFRSRMEQQGYQLDEARLSPRHREGTLSWLEYRRELGCPWSRVEERLGLQPKAAPDATSTPTAP